MADIAPITCVAVKVVYQETHPAGVAILQGQLVLPDSVTGRLKLANGTAGQQVKGSGLALTKASIGQPVTVLYIGLVDVGNVLTALAFGAELYASATAGALADAAAAQPYHVGRVVPGNASITPDKLLAVNTLA